MTEQNGSVLRSVAWAEVFPWLIIFKTFRLAIGFRALAMSTLAVMLTILGWWMFGAGLSCDPASASQPTATCPFEQVTNIVPDRPDLLAESDNAALPQTKVTDKDAVAHLNRVANYEPITGTWTFLSRPLWSGFGIGVSWWQTLKLILCGVWALAVWAFFGAAITRIAAVQLAANERITWGASLRFACSKYLAYFFAPLFPLILVAISAIPVLILGWLLWTADWTAIIVSVFFWPLLLLLGLTMALLLVGLTFGWPLMWPTISTEGTDTFDAFSRSYAAVYQRPLHYLFYVIVAMVLGFLSWIFVKNFASTVVWTTYWAASWGSGATRMYELINFQTPDGKELAGAAYASAWMIRFWVIVAKLFAVGFAFSFFWNVYSAIYLLLRRNVDATEMDEVYLDADESEAKFGLPKIVTDEAGAPEVQEPSPRTETPASAAPAKATTFPDVTPAFQENSPPAPEKPFTAEPPVIAGEDENKPSSPII